ncbi:membrane protein insertion efficiency factor YidD [Vibrio navarrensis]
MIRFYRKYISPIKGYKCAFGEGGHGLTCSTYGLMIFKRYSAPIALKLLKRRFARCASVAKKCGNQKARNALCDFTMCCCMKANESC